MAQDSKALKPEICVIGAGAGGLSAAATAATLGAPVLLVENAKIGGDSLRNNSLSSQALIAAAERAKVLRNGAQFGAKSIRAGVDFAAVRAHVHSAVAAAAPHNSRERLAGLGVRVIAGAARFVDSHTVASDDITINAHRFIIATGSSPAVPAIPGLAETPYLTSETVFDLTDCPRHLIVIGAGAVGLELAQAYRKLGAEVTVLDAGTPLDRDDPECAGIVLEAIERDGVTLRTGVKILRVRRSLARIDVDIATPAGMETIDCTHLLIAAGREPNIEDLDLDAAGIRCDARGIMVDKYLRTTNKRVYAIGDVTGGAKFTHLADHHAALAVRHALWRMRTKVDHQVIPSVIYTDPELAQVGFLEEEARAHSGAIRVLRWPYRDNDRAQATGATNGHIKVITDRRGDILGATIVGAHAGENIAVWTLAINQKLNISAIAGLIVPHPTYGEVGKRAAGTYFRRSLTGKRARRIMGWLRRLG
jgi:pyruvate/2-oxoglutarate dehydrogenase complex dihydrolipoamide dehydrogenase (E3) component